MVRLEIKDIYILLTLMTVIGLLNLAVPIAVQMLVNTVTMGALLKPLLIISLMLFMFLSLAGSLYVLETYVVELIQRRLFVRAALDVARNIHSAQLVARESTNTVELVNRFFEVTSIQKAAGALLTLGISSILQAVIGSLILIFYSVYFGIVVALIFLVVVFVVFVIGSKGESTAIRESQAKYDLAAWLESIARNLGIFKFSSGLNFAMERTDRLANDYLDKRVGHFRILLSQYVGGVFLYAFAGTAMLALGGSLVLSGQINLGQFVAAELIIFTVLASFLRFIGQLQYYYDLLAGVDKLGIIYDLPQERSGGHVAEIGGAIKLDLNGITVESASGKSLIQDLSLNLEAGGNVAFLGSSGTGKSTLAEIITGLRPPTRGNIHYNSIDLQLFNIEAIRKRIGLANKVEIIEDSILENVRVGRPDIKIEVVATLLERLGLQDAIDHLGHGLDTKLHYTGSPLSSSQAKLVMIARAVLAKPALLVIDDLLDTLCPENLEKVISVLLDPQQEWTLIVLTRLEAVAQRFDRIVYLDAN